MSGRGDRVVHRHRIGNMNDLHQSDAGQLFAKTWINGGRQMVAKLKCVRAAATLLRDDGVRRVLTSKEESSNRRWHGVGNPRNRLLGNDARTTGHPRDKAQCRSAAANREHRLRGRVNAADFDSWACLHGVCRSRLNYSLNGKNSMLLDNSTLTWNRNFIRN